RTSQALDQMAIRMENGHRKLGDLVRERQSIVAQLKDIEEIRTREMLKNDRPRLEPTSKLEDDFRRRQALGERLVEIDKGLEADFPDYMELTKPRQLTIAETQQLLNPDEALVVLLNVPDVDWFAKKATLPGEGIAWIVTKQATLWYQIPFAENAF